MQPRDDGTVCGAHGSITGFDSIDMSGNGTTEIIAPAYFSLSEAMARIRRIEEATDPNYLYSVSMQILQHIQNDNNPHNVTYIQTGADAVQELYNTWIANGNTGTLAAFTNILLTRYNVAAASDITTTTAGADSSLVSVSGANSLIAAHNADANAHSALISHLLPGTPPNAPPVYGLCAALGTIPVAGSISRASSINVIDATGSLVTIGPNLPAIDYSHGQAELAMWNTRTNLLTVSDPTALSATLLGCNVGAVPANTLAPDRTSNYLYLTESNNNETHGYAFPITISLGSEYTDSVFIYPYKSSGFITLYIQGAPTNYVCIDIANQVISTTSGNVIGHLVVLPNGWFRVGIQYLLSLSGAMSTNLVIAQTPTNTGSIQSYQGTGVPLFGLFGLQHAAGHGMAPYIPTTNGPATLAATTYTETLTTNSVLAGMVSVNYHHSETLNTMLNKAILSLGTGIAISELNGNTNTAITHSDSTVTNLTQPAAYGQSIFVTLSYSQTAIEYAVTGTAKSIHNGSFNPLSNVSTLTIQPFDGSILGINIYNVPDTSTMLEFLKCEMLP